MSVGEEILADKIVLDVSAAMTADWESGLSQQQYRPAGAGALPPHPSRQDFEHHALLDHGGPALLTAIVFLSR